MWTLNFLQLDWFVTMHLHKNCERTPTWSESTEFDGNAHGTFKTKCAETNEKRKSLRSERNTFSKTTRECSLEACLRTSSLIRKRSTRSDPIDLFKKLESFSTTTVMNLLTDSARKEAKSLLVLSFCFAVAFPPSSDAYWLFTLTECAAGLSFEGITFFIVSLVFSIAT
jgi:hypothetical protein